MNRPLMTVFCKFTKCTPIGLSAPDIFFLATPLLKIVHSFLFKWFKEELTIQKRPNYSPTSMVCMSWNPQSFFSALNVCSVYDFTRSSLPRFCANTRSWTEMDVLFQSAAKKFLSIKYSIQVLISLLRRWKIQLKVRTWFSDFPIKYFF